MSDAYMLFLIENSRANLERILRSIISRCGISVCHPDTGLVIAAIDNIWASGLGSDYLYQELDKSIVAGHTFTLQLWWEGYWDVVCTIYQSGEHLSLNFSLDGVREANRIELQSELARIMNEHPEIVVGLITDFDGHTAEFDYEKVLTTGICPPEMPDIFLVSMRCIDSQILRSNSLIIRPITAHIGQVERICATN